MHDALVTSLLAATFTVFGIATPAPETSAVPSVATEAVALPQPASQADVAAAAA